MTRNAQAGPPPPPPPPLPSGQQTPLKPGFQVPSLPVAQVPTPGVTPSGNGAHQKQSRSIFRFRSERANWIAVVAIIITLLLGILAIVYSAEGVRLAEDSKRLALWEAEKDYQLYCQGLQASHQHLSSDCDQVVNTILKPPPFHDPGAFIHLLARIRRSFTGSLPPTAVISGRVSSVIWFTVNGLVGGLGCIIILADYYDIADDDEPNPEEKTSLATGLKHLTALLLPLVFRVMALLLYSHRSPDVAGSAPDNGIDNDNEDENDLPAQTRGILSAIWVLGHLWSFHITRKSYIYSYAEGRARRLRPVWRQLQKLACFSAMLRAWNGFIMAYGQGVGAIMLGIFDMFCTACYTDLNWNDGQYWRGRSCEIADPGPFTRVPIWYLGTYLNMGLGLLYWCHLTLGGAFLWLTGNPVIELDHVLKPYLLLGRKLLAVSMLVYDVIWVKDILVHRRRHRRPGFVRDT